MIIGNGRLKKTILFDIENQNITDKADMVGHYLTTPAEFFPLQEQYELPKIIFLDLIVGAFYVFATPHKSIEYDAEIRNHFVNHFTSEEKFESELNSLFNDLKFTSEVITNQPDRNLILKELREEITEVYDKQLRIHYLFDIKRISNLTLISLRFLGKFKKYLELLLKETSYTTREIVERNYYNKNPHISSRQQPLAYFENVVSLGSLDEVHRQDWYLEHLDYSEGENKDVLISPYREEFFKTIEILKENLARLSDKDQKKYVREIVAVVKTLIEKSSFLSAFKDYTRPYVLLMEWFKENGFRINLRALNLLVARDYIHLYEDENFLFKLSALKYVNGEKEIQLFGTGVSIGDLKLFIKGNLNSINNKICVLWKQKPFYYLISRIHDYERHLSLPSKLFRYTGKNFEFSSGRVFNIKTYYNVASKANKDLPGNSKAIIDNLFSDK